MEPESFCSRQCMELLPKGLTSLELWWVFWSPYNPCCVAHLPSNFSTFCDQSQILTQTIALLSQFPPQGMHLGP
jgi:hypothetical protein